ncbi:DedA family protein [Paenibacillus sp. N1-5-1-14]|uniref:DedA family protein n=1 Tax=Paenibacillus radicibacter TaxID=2972488 RepID=UPI002158A69A|nr:DedA family protein [Paenibacillus radicibacter]MCR8642813.1 DedA family protein [Paenibacillus radicibacter]
MEWVSNLFEQYGYLVLILGLFAESIALPFPGELAMAISGHMSTIAEMNITMVIVYSYVGAIIGTAVTYMIGYKLGTPFVAKYGKYVFLKQERVEKLSKWFDRYGNKLILISYFVPGLRHFTGYVSGILKVPARTFFIYNCIGGFVWVMLYTMIGLIFGAKFEQLLHLVSRYSILAIGIAAIGVGIFLYVKHNRQRIAARLRTRAQKSHKA